MELIEAIKTRRSVRKYTDKPVEKEKIQQLIEAAILAPSAMNSQGWAFGVIQGAGKLKEYSDRAKELLLSVLDKFPVMEKYRDSLSDPDFNIFYGTSALLLIFARQGDSPQPDKDCCMAAQNVMLRAHDLGLATCWIGFSYGLFNSPEVKKDLGVPESYEVVAPLIVGYPDGEMPMPPRNEPEILFWKE